RYREFERAAVKIDGKFSILNLDLDFMPAVEPERSAAFRQCRFLAASQAGDANMPVAGEMNAVVIAGFVMAENQRETAALARLAEAGAELELWKRPRGGIEREKAFA